MTRSIVIHDADRIQDYVFATGKLREIRGASALVDSLTTTSGTGVPTLLDELLKGFPSAEVVLAGGGNFTAWFPNNGDAERFDTEYSARFYEQTRQATSTGVVHGTDKPYLTAYREAREMLQVKKRVAAASPFMEAGGLIKPCESCARYPASHSYDEPDGVIRLCTACKTKRDFAGKDLPRIYDEFFGHDERRHRFELVPSDFSEIGAASTPKGYIAVVYCDGNGIGQRLRELAASAAHTKDDQESPFREFSDKIDRATRDSLVKVLRQRYPKPPLKREENAPYYPFQIIFCGGDDLLVVLPASDGIEVAVGFVDTFAQNDLGLTTCAGVVIAKDSHPVRELVGISKDLLKSAKKLARSKAQGALDIMIVKASSAGSVEDDRRNSYRTRDKSANLAPGPLSTSDARSYIDAVREMGGLPVSRVKSLARSVTQGYLKSMLYYYDFSTRAKPQQRECLENVRHMLGLDLGLWASDKSANQVRSSPMLVLSEWYPFLAQGKEDQS